jgi:aspartyl-tRNA(Asn)/glutamyl-tRNA(Gln) amidotransferase subunit C
MAITREQVEHVARLAHLALTEEELDRFGEQLGAILEAVGKVSELDLVNVWREDDPQPSLPREDALANAPETEGGFFKVPPAIGPEPDL